jgi:hypothetical protein
MNTNKRKLEAIWYTHNPDFETPDKCYDFEWVTEEQVDAVMYDFNALSDIPNLKRVIDDLKAGRIEAGKRIALFLDKILIMDFCPNPITIKL